MRQRLSGPVEVGGGIHDGARVAAQLEHHLLLARARLHRPADAGRAGEGQQLEPLVLDQPVAQLPAHGQDGHGARRQAGLVDDLGDREHRERVAGGRLEHDGATRRDGRGDLVGRQVEREVEGTDGRHRADREAPGDADATLATTALRSSGMVSPVMRSASSAPSRKVRMARSTSPSASRMGLPDSRAMTRASSSRRRADAVLDVVQRAGPLHRRQPPRPLEARDGGLDRLLVLRLGRGVGRARGGAGSAGSSTTRTSGELTQRPAR